MKEPEVLELMAEYGLIVTILSFGKVVKVSTRGKPTKKNGWYFINEFNGDISGVFGNYDEYGDQKIPIKGRRPQAVARQQQASRQAERVDGKAAALKGWNLCERYNVQPHDYVDRKKLNRSDLISNGVRLDIYGNLVFMLMRNNEFAGIQRIKPDGTKMFNKGMEMKGAYHLIDGRWSVPCDAIAICEGIATGYTLAKLSKCERIICCLSACNIAEVASQFKGESIHYYADNDCNNKVNTGREAALANARLFDRIYIPEEHGDINDMYCKYGKDFELERLK